MVCWTHRVRVQAVDFPSGGSGHEPLRKRGAAGVSGAGASGPDEGPSLGGTGGGQAAGLTMEAGGLGTGVDFSGGGSSQVTSQAALTQWKALLQAEVWSWQADQLWGASCEPLAGTSGTLGAAAALGPGRKGAGLRGWGGPGSVSSFPG